jgi:hypothetical protein
VVFAVFNINIPIAKALLSADSLFDGYGATDYNDHIDFYVYCIVF